MWLSLFLVSIPTLLTPKYLLMSEGTAWSRLTKLFRFSCVYLYTSKVSQYIFWVIIFTVSVPAPPQAQNQEVCLSPGKSFFCTSWLDSTGATAEENSREVPAPQPELHIPVPCNSGKGRCGLDYYTLFVSLSLSNTLLRRRLNLCCN